MKKFLLEADLHRLAFWLRLLGQDAFLIKGAIEKKEITKHPDRVFVTTSRKLESHLKAWHVDYVLLPRGDWKLQLCLLIRHFHIEPVLKLNRCYYCNVELIAVSREQVRDKIPHMVYLYGKDFTLCPNCGKVYWKGSHHPKLRRVLKKILSSC